MNLKRTILTIAFAVLFCSATAAQSTMTYQGSLADNGSPATGNYDFEYAFYNDPAGGTALNTASALNVPIASGNFRFEVNLANVFTSGGEKYLEIRVRSAGGGGYTTLTPRQKVTAVPTAKFSQNAFTSLNANLAQNALQLNGVSPSQYVLTTDNRLSDARSPLPGSSNYIQNGAGQQAGAFFNIQGVGEADRFTARTDFAINDVKILSNNGSSNIFVGANAGGAAPGSVGSSNSFVGSGAGRYNSGSGNSFFGTGSGLGQNGQVNSGGNNSFFGEGAGSSNRTGTGNTALGWNAGNTNTTGSNLTLLGSDSDTTQGNLSYAAAIGAGASVGSSNMMVLGRSAGQDRVVMPGRVSVGSDTNNYAFVNITSPNSNGSLFIAGDNQTKGVNIAVDSTTGADAKMFIAQYDGTTFQDRMVMNEFGVFSIAILGVAGSTQMCRNASLQFASCSSSIRYKNNVEDFSSGLDILRRLRPVTFNWKDSGTLDLGLVAEEVAEIEPLLATYRDGVVEGVKYDRIGVVLVNVVKEQQKTIESLRDEVESEKEKVKRQSEEIEQLKKAVCEIAPNSAVCQ